MSTVGERLKKGLVSIRSLASWVVTAADTAVFGSTAIGVSTFDPGGSRSYHVGKAWSSFNL